MTAPAQTRPVPGVWPLGLLTVQSTATTPVPVTTNVGSQVSSGRLPYLPQDAGTTRPYTSKVQQLSFSAPAGNTGDIYVCYGKYGGEETNAILLIVSKGEQQSIPAGAPLAAGAIDVNQIYISGANSGDVVAVYAIWGN